MFQWRMNHKDQELAERYTIEGFEDTWAVLEVEASRTFNVPRAWLPSEAAEGDVLKVSLEGGGEESGVRFTLDAEATADLKRRVQEAQAKRRVPKAPPGDIEL